MSVFEAGSAGDITPCAVLSSSLAGAMKLGIMACMVQKDSYALGSGMYQVGIAGDIAPCAVLSSLIGWLMMLGIMGGIVHMDSYAFLWQWHVQGSFCWYFAPLAVFLSLSAGPPLGLQQWPVAVGLDSWDEG